MAAASSLCKFTFRVIFLRWVDVEWRVGTRSLKLKKTDRVKGMTVRAIWIDSAKLDGSRHTILRYMVTKIGLAIVFQGQTDEIVKSGKKTIKDHINTQF